MPGLQVTEGALMCCSFGTAPRPLVVTSNQGIMIDGRLAATVDDCAPFANLPPFAGCLSPANPLFGSFGAAAAGGPPAVPPCTPIATGPWSPPSLISTIHGTPALQFSAVWTCGYAGVVQFVDSGQATAEETGD